MELKDIKAELEAAPEGAFLELVSFNDTHFGACSVTGVSPVWEMHPDTDEFYYILEGEAEITLLEDSGAKCYTAPAGTVFVVPKGICHKSGVPSGAKFMYFTPGISLHSEAEDPRQ
jgi:mannose-6-phosphate isomerase-like protein (cupin superfamily)